MNTISPVEAISREKQPSQGFPNDRNSSNRQVVGLGQMRGAEAPSRTSEILASVGLARVSGNFRQIITSLRQHLSLLCNSTLLADYTVQSGILSDVPRVQICKSICKPKHINTKLPSTAPFDDIFTT